MSKSISNAPKQYSERQSLIHDAFTILMNQHELMEYFSNVERFISSSCYQRTYTRRKGKKGQTE